MDLYKPSKSSQNSLIARFNRTSRQDILNSYMFGSLTEFRKCSQAWACMYNNEKPHADLGYSTPVEYFNFERR